MMLQDQCNKLTTNMASDFPINNLKQIRHKKYYHARKESDLLIYQILLINFNYKRVSYQRTDDKSENLEPHYGIVIFNDYQMLNIEEFCCSGMTTLGVDETYQLGNIFITGSVFKNLAIVNSETREVPIFLGPLYLHPNSTLSDFHPFFSCLAGKLKDINTNNLIISSDDEQALVRAINSNFPNSNHFLCSRHHIRYTTTCPHSFKYSNNPC